MAKNVVVVGYGMSGKLFHCYLVKLAEGLRLHGVVARDPQTRQKAAAEQQCRTYASLEEALADRGVDLIVLATPNSTHADLAVQAMAAGKHVVTDKVMCLNLADCDRMVEASRRSGVLLSVFQNRRLDGDYLTVRDLMQSGELGDVRWLEMAWQGMRPMRGWRGKAAMGGGRYFDLGAHLVDQLCMLFPAAVASVYCRMHHDHAGSDAESEALLVVGFADGRTGVCDLSSMAAISKPRFYVRGTKATFAKYGLDPQEAAMRRGAIDEAKEDTALYGTLRDSDVERRVPTTAGRWRGYYENIAEVLARGAQPLVKLDEVRRAISVLDAGVRSAASGDVVKF